MVSPNSNEKLRPRSSGSIQRLSLGDTLRLSISHFGAGLKDAFAFPASLLVVYGSKTIQTAFFKCVVLNGILFLGSMVLFNALLDPATDILANFMKRQDGTLPESIRNGMTIVYHVFWLYPLYLTSLMVNSIWYQQISNRAYRMITGKAPITQQDRMTKNVATNIYRGLIYIFYLSFATIIFSAPIVGPLVSFLLFCWFCAFYSFEFRWVNQGWNIDQCMDYFEEHWAYMAGFGFPPTLVSFFFSQLVNAGIFALVFPLYVIMATRATALPRHSQQIRNSIWIPHRLSIFYLSKKSTRITIQTVKYMLGSRPAS
ncbi:uncharacterized protein VTP21DRAFT_2391 [Calcarisporiella thermophila]|uniref:uncharacterized protein n=1 Tax=Calcarisporiella thermophila TaxID=911321 RepID=UPI003743C0FC